MTNERPILFQTPMVKGIIDNRKTMTRRINGLDLVNENPEEWRIEGMGPKDEKDQRFHAYFNRIGTDTLTYLLCPYGKPGDWLEKGDLLWVREAFTRMDGEYIFRASVKYPETLKWKPSIHMPKSAARIWLEITDIRVERLQDISENDAIAEGIEVIGAKYSTPCFRLYHNKYGHTTIAKDSFKSLWESINGPDSWNQNPWAWVVCFKVLSTTGKPLPATSYELSEQSTERSRSGSQKGGNND